MKKSLAFLALSMLIFLVLFTACGITTASEQTAVPNKASADAAFAATSTATQVPSATPTLEPTPFPHGHTLINADNVDRVEKLAEVGVGNIMQVGWAADGSQFYVITSSGVFSFDAENYELLESKINPEWFDAVLLIPQSGQLITANSEVIHIRDIQSWEKVFDFTPGGDITLSPDGGILAVHTEEGRVVCWNIVSGDKLSDTEVDYGDFVFNSVTPDGKTLVLITAAKTITLVDAEDGSKIGELESTAEFNSAPDLSPNGQYLAATAGRDILVWDLTSQEMVYQITTPEPEYPEYNAVRFSSDGKIMASANEFGSIEYWDAENGSKLNGGSEYDWKMQTGFNSYDISDMAFYPDSQYLVALFAGGEIKVYDADEYIEKASINSLRNAYNTVEISSNGDTLVTGFAYTNVFQIRDMQSGEVLAMLDQRPDDYPYLYAFLGADYKILPDGETLLSTSMAGINTFSLPEGELLSQAKEMSFESAIALSPDGKNLFLVNSQPVSITVWDVDAQEIITTIPVNTEYAITDMAISPDGTLLAAGTTHFVYVWNTANWSLAATISEAGSYSDFLGVYSTVNKVQFSPDGTSLITCDDLDVLQSWSTSNWSLQATYEKDFIFMDYTDAYDIAMAFSPDSSLLAVAVQHVIEILDASTLEVLTRVSESAYNVNDIAFTPDGKELITGQWGRIVYWGIP
jgi:WD40 repeat protein